MKRMAHIRVMSGFLIVCFLFSSILSNPVLVNDSGASFVKTLLGENGNTPSKSDTGLPDEEKAGEERPEDAHDGETERLVSSLVLIGCIVESPSLAITESQLYFFDRAPRSCGIVTSIPRYLSQLTLLI